MVPPGVPHTFANPGDQPAVLLNTFTPDLYVQYFRDLRTMIANGQPLTAAASAQVMSRYATSPATDSVSPERSSDMTNAITRTVHLRADQSDLPVTIAEVGSGRTALANARFTLVTAAGHLPHIEQPSATFAALDAYLQSGA